MLLGAKHRDLVEPQSPISLSEGSILDNQAIPPISIWLCSAERELFSCFHLNYYMIILCFILHNFNTQILFLALVVQVGVDFHLTVLSLWLVYMGVVSIHCLVQLPREYVVVIFELEGRVIRIEWNRKARRCIQVATLIDVNLILSWLQIWQLYEAKWSLPIDFHPLFVDLVILQILDCYEELQLVRVGRASFSIHALGRVIQGQERIL